MQAKLWNYSSHKMDPYPHLKNGGGWGGRLSLSSFLPLLQHSKKLSSLGVVHFHILVYMHHCHSHASFQPVGAHCHAHDSTMCTEARQGGPTLHHDNTAELSRYGQLQSPPTWGQGRRRPQAWSPWGNWWSSVVSLMWGSPALAGRPAATNRSWVDCVSPITPVTLTASNFTEAHLINHVPPITHVTLTASNSTEAQLINQHLLAMPGQDLCETCYFIKDFILLLFSQGSTSVRNWQHLRETG